MKRGRIKKWIIGLLLIAPVSLGLAQVEGQGEVRRLTLEESLQLGLANNPMLRAAEAKLDSVKGQMVSARSNFFPKLTASGTMVRTNMLTEFKTGDLMMLDTTFPLANSAGDPAPPDHIHKLPFAGFSMSNTREGNIYNGKVEATMPLFTGGKVIQGYKAAELETAAQEEDLRRLKLDTVYQVKQAFYGVLLAQAMVGVVDKSYSTVEAHYKRVQDLFRQGMVSNLDLLQVESQMSAIRPQQIQVHNGLELARLRLLAVLNLALDTNLEVAGELGYAPSSVEEIPALKAKAEKDRPEMRSLDIRVEQAKRLKKIALAGYAPTVAAFANYQWNRGQEMPPNDTLWRDGWQAGLSLSLPLFDGLNTHGQIQNVRGLENQLLMSQTALRSGIEAEVTASALTLRASEEKIAAMQISVQAAEKNYKVSEDRYAVGMVNHLDVMDAEVSLTRARADYLQAVYDYLMARASLEKASGQMEEVAP